MRFVSVALTALLIGSLTADPGRSQEPQKNRRDREDPELVVESGGRLGYCDQMLFTGDGKWLLTVGDDKVVRLWACSDGKLDPASMRVLRWGIWREYRGAIYALAISPDPEGKFVAVGGVGELTTTVAVFDRTTGQIVHHGVPMAGRNLFGVMSLAFSPSGKQLALGTADGSVFVWDFKTFRAVGRHDPTFGNKRPANTTPLPNDGFNRVRFVRFLAEDRLISVSESSEVVEWDLSKNPAKRTLNWVVGKKLNVRSATATSDNQYLAFGLYGPLVALRSLDGKVVKDIDLGKESKCFPRSVAFDAAGRTLAVGVGDLAPSTNFYMETNDHVRLFDLTGAQINRLEHAGRAESVAFQPDGKLLAVAGGNNHEVSLCDLGNKGAAVSVMKGAGTGLWDIGLSKDGNVVGFKDHRDDASANPNARGKGPWRTFLLKRLQFQAADDFQPVARLETVGGWTVKPDPKDPFLWYAVLGGKPFPLDLDGARDAMPRCYTFVEPSGDTPARLVVGHYWGLSIYELRPGGPKRVRLCVGHQGDVTAVGLSADRTWLVSCSNDQTIAAWSLTSQWPSQAILGAAFEKSGERLRVTAVDAGSPAWEAGLQVGDEVFRFAFAAKEMLDGPDAWLKRLKDPVPGKEHYFMVLRGKERVDMLTTVRQRPIWRLFPTRGGEWVLWMWRNSFYATSTNGDFHIGWHVNNPVAGGTPRFYQAQQLRRIYNKPTLIYKLLQARDVRAVLQLVSDNPLPLRFDDSEPPAVKIEGPERKGAGWQLKLTVTPFGTNDDLLPREAELWINDYRLYGPEQWADVRKWDSTKVGQRTTYVKTVLIKPDDLRAGRNVLTFQTANRLGGRAETAVVIDNPRRPPAKPNLWGAAVGIDRYEDNFVPPKKEVPGLPRDYKLGDLQNAVHDASSMQKAWEKQKYYADTRIVLLSDKDANRAGILRALDAVAANAKPDDVCVLTLSGHGLFRAEENDAKRSSFIFCCAVFKGDAPDESGIPSQLLYEKLASIKCRKLVILDACHSGEAASNPVRGLTPNGQGPFVLAACDRNQLSFENKRLSHGLFTYALLEALGTKKADADRDGNGVVEAEELYQYTLMRMPELLKDIQQPEFLQVPIRFDPRREPFPIAVREPGPGKEK